MLKWFRRPLYEWSRRQRVILALVTAVTLLFCAVAEVSGLFDHLLLWCGVSQTFTVPAGDEIQVHTLDVGNADATLLLCDGKAVLIDAGAHDDGNMIADYLQRYGITHLTYVIATHEDADHVGGMQNALKNCTVGEYLMPPQPQGVVMQTDAVRQLYAFLDERNIPMSETTAGALRTFGEATIKVLSPSVQGDNANAQSLVCLVIYRNNRFLFMGDADLRSEIRLLTQQIDADFLKVGHHGSDDSSGEAFLRGVSPTVAVISCGDKNPYGHPAPIVEQRLRNLGATVYRTDNNGRIITVGDGDTLRVITEKE